ncbi:hypothetical protein CPB84DRAFT_1836771 [Gymnopilus junonius]|uniref:phosphatidylinositol-3,4,5-trisphosphate 3-phosphatase n=1 Tax=Gymnopilus junonius TaxID=109634 RepID=A0A9P5NPS8_GYMJU|nr:hypothetical protein CPB84DRAFT_1836771 [Gymnopilus junonius]
MTDYIRRIVSGNRARFKDNSLNLELDLTYVTDQVIIMGYPASGIEALYRNSRHDAKRFLEHRHGKNYWVFNFCPLKENSYDPETFDGRVSRYPFPDHHAPPLALIPLAVREIRTWLQGSSDRVAVLHCKAGKGRSGTMACAYLLYNAKEWAKRRMEDTLEIMPPDNEPHQTKSDTTKPLSAFQQKATIPSDTEGLLDVESGSSPPFVIPNPEKSFTDALKGVLDLHTARRMKALSGYNGGKVSQGVSIPSQRRFLYYWALVLAREAPKHFWAVEPPRPQVKDGGQHDTPLEESKAPHPKVRLTQLKLRMRETSGMKMNILKAANLVIERTSLAKGPAFSDPKNKRADGEKSPHSPHIWASLARYDDGLVDLLEEWEVYTRDLNGHFGKRRPGSHHRAGSESNEELHLNRAFTTGTWDNGKMVKSFAHLAAVNGEEGKIVDDKEGKIHIYTLQPLSDKRWENLKHDIHVKGSHDSQKHAETEEAIDENANVTGISRSEANSMYDLTGITEMQKDEIVSNMAFGAGLEPGVILDAGRELRVKLYMGQVFMGWFWFIPTFHMPQPPPSSSASLPSTTKAKVILTRKDLDFALGIGSSIIDVEIEMEWVVPPSPVSSATTPATEPDQTSSSRLRTRTDQEPSQNAIATALQMVLDSSVEGGVKTEEVREIIEAKQGDAD